MFKAQRLTSIKGMNLEPKEQAVERPNLSWGSVGVFSTAISATSKGRKSTAKRCPKAEAICRLVAMEYKISKKDLFRLTRQPDIVWPRQVAMALIRQTTGATLKSIASFFGRKNHATTLHATRLVRRTLEIQDGWSDGVLRIKSKIHP